MKYLTKYPTLTAVILCLIVAFILQCTMTLTMPEALAVKENSQNATEQYFDGTVSTMSGENHIYYFGVGITPIVPYVRFYNRTTQQLYNSTTGSMGAKASVAWADSEVLMTDETLTVGGWLLVTPDEYVRSTGLGVPNGWYDVLVYERVGATPASTDTLYLGRSCKMYNGSVISFDDR